MPGNRSLVDLETGRHQRGHHDRSPRAWPGRPCRTKEGHRVRRPRYASRQRSPAVGLQIRTGARARPRGDQSDALMDHEDRPAKNLLEVILHAQVGSTRAGVRVQRVEARHTLDLCATGLRESDTLRSGESSSRFQRASRARDSDKIWRKQIAIASTPAGQAAKSLPLNGTRGTSTCLARHPSLMSNQGAVRRGSAFVRK